MSRSKVDGHGSGRAPIGRDLQNGGAAESAMGEKHLFAEALFATALGLLAAIPATIFYNMFTADTAKIGARLENFADEFSAIISRQLDERV